MAPSSLQQGLVAWDGGREGEREESWKTVKMEEREAGIKAGRQPSPCGGLQRASSDGLPCEDVGACSAEQSTRRDPAGTLGAVICTPRGRVGGKWGETQAAGAGEVEKGRRRAA